MYNLVMEKYLDLRNNNDYTQLKNASDIIKKGGLVLFPTETVYGIGADGLNAQAVSKIFDAKGRAQDNPLILHICSMEMLEKIAKDITDIEYKLMERFWPGPFTIILKKQACVPDVVTGGLDTVAVRMPEGKIALELIKHSNTPIAAPSANMSGRPSGTCVEDIYEELKDKMDYIIDGGKCDVGIESTVVKVDKERVIILRPGKITKEQIEKVVSNVEIDKNVLGVINSNEKVLSPGMKYKHYAPKSKCILMYSKNNDNMVNEIKNMANKYKNPIIICKESNLNSYDNFCKVSYGETLDEIASNIFRILRSVDIKRPDIVLIEGVEQNGIGLAIMNRLIRACSNNFLEI